MDGDWAGESLVNGQWFNSLMFKVSGLMFCRSWFVFFQLLAVNGFCQQSSLNSPAVAGRLTGNMHDFMKKMLVSDQHPQQCVITYNLTVIPRLIE